MQKLLVLMLANKNTLNTLSTLGVFSSYTEEVLSNKHYAKIHSIFSNGFNLNFDGELIYISYHQKGMLSARGLSIDKNVFDTLTAYLKIGVHVRVREKRLIFYTRPHILTMNITQKTIKDLKVISVSEKQLESIEFKNRLKRMNLLEKSGFFKYQVLMDILKNIQKTKEISLNDINQLIGAGIGLTPTGDDFLQGLILMEQTFGHPPHIQMKVQQLLNKCSTTEVSLSYYEALFAGYSNEPLVLLFKAAKDQEIKKLNEALSSIQEYGETSGHDLLIGIFTYLQIL